MIFPGPRSVWRYFFFALLWVVPVASSHSSPAGQPLYVKNLSPVVGLFGLPSQRAAFTQAPETIALALHSSVASHYVSEFNTLEGINLDGETLRFALEARYGFADNWDIQVEIPWLEHSGGHLDSLIDNWHELWGMPDGGRSDVARNLLDYRYGGPDSNFALLDDASGLGDVTLSLNYAFYQDENSTASIGLGYKFGTGEEDDLLGSGADDIYLALRFSGRHLTDLPLSWHGQVGYLNAGDSDVLAGAQENNLWFAGLAVDWTVLESVSLIAQLDAHTAPLDSELDGPGEDAILLSLGARWRFAQHWAVDINFVEDIRVATAPDITFQASLRYYNN